MSINIGEKCKNCKTSVVVITVFVASLTTVYFYFLYDFIRRPPPGRRLGESCHYIRECGGYSYTSYEDVSMICDPYSSTCVCTIPDVSVYSDYKQICLLPLNQSLRVDPGRKTSSVGIACIENAQLVPVNASLSITKLHCQCKNGFYPSADGKSCKAKGDIGTSCALDSYCNEKDDLECVNGICECALGVSYKYDDGTVICNRNADTTWDHQRRNKESCKNDGRKCPQNLVCLNDTCECTMPDIEVYVSSIDGCVNRSSIIQLDTPFVTYRSYWSPINDRSEDKYLSKDDACDPHEHHGKFCRSPLVCLDESKTCGCPFPGMKYTGTETTGRCISGVGQICKFWYNATKDEVGSSKELIQDFASCTGYNLRCKLEESTKTYRCQCDVNFKPAKDPELGCVPVGNLFGGPCSNNNDCFKGYQLRCLANNTCGCDEDSVPMKPQFYANMDKESRGSKKNCYTRLGLTCDPMINNCVPSGYCNKDLGIDGKGLCVCGNSQVQSLDGSKCLADLDARCNHDDQCAEGLKCMGKEESRRYYSNSGRCTCANFTTETEKPFDQKIIYDPVNRVCIKKGSKQLGERCMSDVECDVKRRLFCQSGHCTCDPEFAVPRPTILLTIRDENGTVVDTISPICAGKVGTFCGTDESKGERNYIDDFERLRRFYFYHSCIENAFCDTSSSRGLSIPSKCTCLSGYESSDDGKMCTKHS